MTEITADFETGVNGNDISTSDAGSATAWDNIDNTGAGGSITYSNTHAYGTLAAKYVAPSAGNLRLRWNTAFGTQTDHYGRMYLYLTGYPSITADLMDINDIPIELMINDTSGTLALLDLSGAVVGSVAAAINQWIRIEWHLLHSTTVGVFEVKLFNNADSTTPSEIIGGVANRNTGTSAPKIDFAIFNSFSGQTIWYDNIVAAATSYPGPVEAAGGQTPNLAPVIYGRGAC